MHAMIDNKGANVNVTFVVKVAIDLEPGIWVVQHEGRDCSVTTVQAVVDHRGIVHFTLPKGVKRRGVGWGVKEVLLPGALPLTHPDDAWAAIPQRVRDVVTDSYLLAREETPTAIGSQL